MSLMENMKALESLRRLALSIREKDQQIKDLQSSYSRLLEENSSLKEEICKLKSTKAPRTKRTSTRKKQNADT